MKKAFSLLLACLLVIAAALPASALALGDVDGDGRVSAKDARLALRISARLENSNELQRAAADADGDGNVSAKDARIILRVSARLTTFEEARRPKPNAMALYRPLLEQFRDAAQSGWQGFTATSKIGGFQTSEFWPTRKPAPSAIGYALIDLDNDGTPELLLDTVSASSSITDMFTIVDGQIRHVFSTQQRNTVTLLDDNTLDKLGYGGAFHYQNAYMTFADGSLTCTLYLSVDWGTYEMYEGPYPVKLSNGLPYPDFSAPHGKNLTEAQYNRLKESLPQPKIYERLPLPTFFLNAG